MRNSWIAWSLLSALFAGITGILAKQGVAALDSTLATAIRTTVVLFVTWGVAFAVAAPGAVRQVDRRSLLYLILSGLATGLSWLCYFRALQLGPASRVVPLDKLSVVFLLLFAAMFLGERLPPTALAGAALIVAGAVMIAAA